MSADAVKPVRYSIGHDHTSGKFYIQGPGRGFGCHCGLLFPEMQFVSNTSVAQAVKVAESAYAAGYEQAQADMRKVMGVKQ